MLHLKIERDVIKLFKMMVLDKKSVILYYNQRYMYSIKVVERLLKMLLENEIQHEYNVTQKIVTVGESTLILKNSEEKCRGFAISTFFIDEVSDIDSRTYSLLKSLKRRK